MKQLTTVSVSTIMYIRNKFPKKNFKILKFNGLTLRVFKDECPDDIAQLTKTTLANAYKAFDQKYVRINFILSTCVINFNDQI